MKTCPKCYSECHDKTRFCPNCGENILAVASSNQDQWCGRTIAGNFLLHELIGVGAMGSIYKAEQISLGKTVCIKLLHRHLMGDQTLPKRFRREARAAARLKHPNCIEIIDFGQSEQGVLYIAMEYVNGVDLAQLLHDEFPLNPSRTIHVTRQVLSALDEAHAHSIIHRDLKPENVMVENRRFEHDFVKVLDFGIAKIQEREEGSYDSFQTVAGVVCGTPEYMSPEQAKGETLDARSDLYSVGVMLYQMTTNGLPFTGDTPISIVTRHLTEQPVPPSEVNPNLHPAMEELILRLMSKDRDVRPPSALAVHDELEKVGALIAAEGLGGEVSGAESTIPSTNPEAAARAGAQHAATDQSLAAVQEGAAVAAEAARRTPTGNAAVPGAAVDSTDSLSLDGPVSMGRPRWLPYLVASAIVLATTTVLIYVFGIRDSSSNSPGDSGNALASVDGGAGLGVVDAGAVGMPVGENSDVSTGSADGGNGERADPTDAPTHKPDAGAVGGAADATGPAPDGSMTVGGADAATSGDTADAAPGATTDSAVAPVKDTRKPGRKIGKRRPKHRKNGGKPDKAKAREEAKELVKDGDAAMRSGNYRLAVKKYNQSLKLVRAAAVLKKIGKCYNSLGQHSQGRRYLQQYLNALSPERRERERLLIEAMMH